MRKEVFAYENIPHMHRKGAQPRLALYPELIVALHIYCRRGFPSGYYKGEIGYDG